MTTIRNAALATMLLAGSAMMAASAAKAGSQSSNTSSNSSSNNGVVRERVDSSYCENGDDRGARWPRNYDRRQYR